MEYVDNCKKITIFLASLRGGGVERAMLNLVNIYTRQGIQIDLVLVSAEGPFLYELAEEVRVFDLKSSRVLKAIPRLVKYIKNEKPQVILSAMTHVNLAAVIAKILSGVSFRLILSEHSSLRESIEKIQTQRVKFRYYLVKFLYHKADRIIAVSEGVKADLIRLFNLPDDKIVVIYNPVVNSELLLKAEETVQHPWLQDNNVPVILCVGRLSKEKDFKTLLKAFALISKKHAARLIILGEGQERSNLNALVQKLKIEEQVSMPGFTSNPYAYMSKATLFVLSSVREGLSNVIVEALACGCPIVSTDCPSGPAEILENGKYGTLVPVDDAEAMAMAIIDVLKKTSDPETLKKRALMFSAERISKLYLEVLILS